MNDTAWEPGPGRVVVLACLVVLAFLPLANWGTDGAAAPGYALTVRGWIEGTALVGGLALLLALAGQRVRWLRLERGAELVAERVGASWRLFAFGTALLLLVLASGLGHWLFDGRPLMVDEIVQTWQARLLARGRLWDDPSPAPWATTVPYVIDLAGRRFGQFPVGGPAVLAVGTLLRAEWVAVPLAGAVGVVAWAWWLRATREPAGPALAAVLFLAFSPFWLAQSASRMNHVPAIAAVLVGAAATAAALAGPVARWRPAVLAGLGFGVAASIRPLDAAAFALPAVAWTLVRVRGDRAAWAVLVALVAGMAVPGTLLLAANAATTGSALRFGYDVMWGPAHGLGFHQAPWGPPHTPLRGLALVNLYLLRLQVYLFEAPVPSLLAAMLALAMLPLRAGDRYLLASGGLLLAAYFCYWHDGFYLGPRFVLGLVPLAALWTARFPAACAARLRSRLAARAAIIAGVVAVIASASAVAARAALYREGFAQRRWDADAAARAAGIDGSLVLVRQSWDEELIARLWALGLPRTDAERLYRGAPRCHLEQALAVVERGTLRGAEAVGPLTSAIVTAPDSAAACTVRAAQDRAGVAEYLPLLLARGGTAWAKSLPGRDTATVSAFRRPRNFVLGPGAVPGAGPTLTPLHQP